MFIKIEPKNIFYSEGDSSAIKIVEEVFFINLDQVIQIEFNECLVKKTFIDTTIILNNLIKLYVLSEDGIWNYLTLYFSKNSLNKFQRIVQTLEKETK